MHQVRKIPDDVVHGRFGTGARTSYRQRGRTTDSTLHFSNQAQQRRMFEGDEQRDGVGDVKAVVSKYYIVGNVKLDLEYLRRAPYPLEYSQWHIPI
jgi:hypothetical protein